MNKVHKEGNVVSFINRNPKWNCSKRM